MHINAHGGGILLHDGVYYWFGEHKVEGEAGNRAQVGVHVYSSSDLYNWKDEGIALAVSDDPTSDITRGSIIERPKVIHCAKTGQFVMWFHLELKGQGYRAARSGVAVSDRPTGPYRFLSEFPAERRSLAGQSSGLVSKASDLRGTRGDREAESPGRPGPRVSGRSDLPPGFRGRTDGQGHDSVRGR